MKKPSYKPREGYTRFACDLPDATIARLRAKAMRDRRLMSVTAAMVIEAGLELDATEIINPPALPVGASGDVK